MIQRSKLGQALAGLAVIAVLVGACSSAGATTAPSAAPASEPAASAPAESAPPASAPAATSWKIGYSNGGGVGNGVSGSSAIVVTLAFDVLKVGGSTLAIATTPAPTVRDRNGATIGAMTFDSAAGTVTGTSTGPY